MCCARSASSMPSSAWWTKARCRSSSRRESKQPSGAQDWATANRRCPIRFRCLAPSAKDRLRRSRLYLPGNEPKYFVNAGLHGPDAVILDLEDSVHHAEKDAARLLVRNALRAVDFGAAERMVRINQLPLGTGRPGRDRSPVARPHPDSQGRDRRAGRRSRRSDHAHCQAARHDASDLADADSGVRARHRERFRDRYGFGPDRGHHHRPRGLHRRPRRGEDAATATSRSTRGSAWSMPHMQRTCRPSIRFTATWRTWTACSAGAKPRAPWASKAWDVFIPCRSRSFIALLRLPQTELEKALKIVAAFEDAQAKGLGVVSLGSKMIDAPVVQSRCQAGERAQQNGPHPDQRRRPGMSTIATAELVTNAAGRRVPTVVNGREQTALRRRRRPSPHRQQVRPADSHQQRLSPQRRQARA